MRVQYSKPHKPLSEQVELLRSRGLDCGPEDLAIQSLHDFSYYTLSAYWYPFRRMLGPSETRETRWQYRASTFLSEATLNDAVEIATFDRKLRHVLFEGLAQLELSLRFQLAHTISRRSPFAHVEIEHLDANNCNKPVPKKLQSADIETDFDYWCDIYDKQIARSKSEDFIKHFQTKYDSEIPIWIAVEVLDFGSLARLFSLIKGADKTEISQRFGISNGSKFHSVLYGLGILRNHVAHHNRVWNRRLSASLAALPVGVVDPEIEHLTSIDSDDRNKLYPWVSVLTYMLKRYDPSTNWHRTLRTQLRKFPQNPIIDGERQMCMPNGWDELELWKSEPGSRVVTTPT